MVLEVENLKWVGKAAFLLEALGGNQFPRLFRGIALQAMQEKKALISRLTETLGQQFSAFGGSRPLNIVSMQTAASPQKRLYPGPLRGPWAEKPLFGDQDSSAAYPRACLAHPTHLTLLSVWLCHFWAPSPRAWRPDFPGAAREAP